jgi:hypothetical protein
MWNTSLISFSSSALMLFSFASLDARPRFGASGAAVRRFGGCAGIRLRYAGDLGGSYHVGAGFARRIRGLGGEWGELEIYVLPRLHVFRANLDCSVYRVQ